MTPPTSTTWQVSTRRADPITISPDVIITCSTPVITMTTSPATPTLASTTALTLTPSLSMDDEDGHPYIQLFPVTTILIHTVSAPARQHLQVYFFIYFSIRYLLFFFSTPALSDDDDSGFPPATAFPDNNDNPLDPAFFKATRTAVITIPSLFHNNNGDDPRPCAMTTTTTTTPSSSIARRCDDGHLQS